jgi:hypothetical protein
VPVPGGARAIAEALAPFGGAEHSSLWVTLINSAITAAPTPAAKIPTNAPPVTIAAVRGVRRGAVVLIAVAEHKPFEIY